jgi:sialate O-acetylesterase
MKKSLPVLFCLSLILSISVARATVTLPAIFNNHMVMQRNAEVAVWGKAKPNSKLTLLSSWNKKTYTTKTGNDGSWKIKIATPEAGGPYTITFNDGEKLVLSDILIGEVWLCSGQSNMEMPVRGYTNQPTLHANEILMEAEELGVRLFRVGRNMSDTLVHNIDVKWQVADIESVKDFSAVGYQFARMLQKTLKVPVGIIQSAFGGTNIETWMDKSSLQGFNDYRERPVNSKIAKNYPAVLYNGMISPIIGYHIKGVIWYQGESNRPNPLTYDKKMAAMVALWRKQWDCGEWPFYYVQVAPNFYRDEFEKTYQLYEAQANAMKIIPNSGMVVSVDVGSISTIHPPDKTTISKRLVYWALNRTYGKSGIAYSSPMYQSMKTNGSKVELSFGNNSLGLTSYDQPLISFEVAGADKVFKPATAVLAGRTVVVESKDVPQPVAVRYAYQTGSAGNLYGGEGLPVAPFRTDAW